MDTIVSITGENFGIVAVNTSYVNSIIVTKEDLDKFIEVGRNKFLIVSGYPGDVSQFIDFIQKTVQLHSLKTGLPLSTHSVANCIRKEVSEYLRKNPFNINIIIMGYDKSIGPSLYSIDHLGALQRMDYCVQGYASLLVFSFLDKHFKFKMNIKQAIEALVRCINMLKKRFVINQINFLIKIVDYKGCRNIAII